MSFSSNLLFCGYYITISNYDETYGVIYEVLNYEKIQGIDRWSLSETWNSVNM